MWERGWSWGNSSEASTVVPPPKYDGAALSKSIMAPHVLLALKLFGH